MNLHPDGVYSKNEIKKIREYYELNDIVRQDLNKLSSLIYKDIRRLNEAELKKDFNKREIVNLVKRIKEKDSSAFENLVSKGVIDENWQLLPGYNWQKGLMIIQTALNLEWYKWKDGRPLAVDGIYWENTFWALIKYQKENEDYKNCGLSCNWLFEGPWKPDGLSGIRTIITLLKPSDENKSDKETSTPDKDKKLKKNSNIKSDTKKEPRLEIINEDAIKVDSDAVMEEQKSKKFAKNNKKEEKIVVEEVSDTNTITPDELVEKINSAYPVRYENGVLYIDEYPVDTSALPDIVNIFEDNIWPVEVINLDEFKDVCSLKNNILFVVDGNKFLYDSKSGVYYLLENWKKTKVSLGEMVGKSVIVSALTANEMYPYLQWIKENSTQINTKNEKVESPKKTEKKEKTKNLETEIEKLIKEYNLLSYGKDTFQLLDLHFNFIKVVWNKFVEVDFTYNVIWLYDNITELKKRIKYKQIKNNPLLKKIKEKNGYLRYVDWTFILVLNNKTAFSSSSLSKVEDYVKNLQK